MRSKRIERIAVTGVISAFAVILSYVETLISIGFFIPGVKLGLANLAVVIVLYLYDGKSAIIVNIIRILIVGLLFTNLFSIMFSIAGAVVSFVFMWLVKRTDFFSPVGVSVVGGVMHNIAQIIIAMLIIESYSVVYYIPFLMIAGIITGVLIGIISALVLKHQTKKEIL